MSIYTCISSIRSQNFATWIRTQRRAIVSGPTPPASTLLVSVQVSVRTTGQAFTAFRTEYRVFQAVFPGKSGQLKL
jgi:hypothetical protein